MFIPHLSLFFDTSFISEANIEDIKLMIEQRVEAKYITDSVYRELQDGYLNNRCNERFSLIFDPLSENRLRNNIKIISLAKCVKDIGPIDFNQDTILIKRNWLLCSGYYAWLHCSVNPSMITDPFRHWYNVGLQKVRTKGDPDNKVTAIIGRLRTQELDFLERSGFKKEGFIAMALKMARKKRLKDIKKNTLKITDYQLVVTAFLYFCLTRNNVMVLTCDNDLVDIKDNLIRSVIEKYTLNRMLTKKLMSLDKCGKLGQDTIELRLTGKEVREDLKNNTFEMIRKDNLSGCFLVAFYNRRDRKIYGGIERIPVWLMNFVLEYRLNFNCYSTDRRLEMKYPINYIMEPTENLEEIHFNITLRKERLYYGLMPDCEDICGIAKKEMDKPSELSSFVEKSVFDSQNRPDFSNPWINRGFSLFGVGRYDEALRAFDKAIDLQVDSADAWYGKGISLGNLNRHEDAFKALEKVIKLKHDYHEAFYSWGGMLLDHAARFKGADREALLEGSGEKFARAVEINPDMPEALYSWGIALWNLAAMREGTYREVLLKEAIEKFAAAAQIKPDMHEAFYQWGNTLLNLAALPEIRDRETLLREAIDKFATALAIKPEMHEALSGWGYALLILADIHEGPMREELLKEAVEKFAKALEIKPENHESFYNWAIALGKLAEFHEGHDREALFCEEIEKFANALRIKPDMHEAIFGWGNALVNIADLHEGHDREVLLKKAVEKFAEADEIKSEHFVLCNWGVALVLLAELQERADRKSLFKKAIEKYNKAIVIKPDYYEALYNLCNALSMLAYVYKGRQRTENLEAALEKAKRVEYLKPGAGIYSMARVYALLGQKKNALASLKKAIESDPQYRQIAAGDEDFRSLWEVEAFKNIVGK